MPSRALRFTPEVPLISPQDIVKDCEGEHKLWTKEGNTFTAHPVQIGISNGIKTEITSGISINEANLGTDNESQPMVENNGENKEQSPFMPGRPGGKKK